MSQLLSEVKQNIGDLYALWSVYSKEYGYPVDYQGFTEKSTPLIDWLDSFKGVNVLDIGCNSGLYSYIAGIYSNSVTGCDIEEVLIRRAEDARSFFQRYFDTKHVTFCRGNFVSRLTSDIGGIVASCVLYHVGDENLLALKEFLTANKPRILLQARPMRAEAFQKDASVGYVAATTLYNGMYRIEDNLDFLRDCGYDKVTISGLKSSSFYGEYFPVIHALP